MPILCVCPNGHQLRVKDKLAGREAVCPKCEARFAVPPPPAAEAPTPSEPSPPAAEAAEAVEWSMAAPDGTRRGPTVPTVFAQWIAAGDVRPDTPVWRTGWAEWRPAGEAAGELPVPLPEVQPTAEPAVPEGLPKPSARRSGRKPPSYAERRAHRAQRWRVAGVVLAVVCVVLAAMLVWLVTSGPPVGVPALPP